MKSKKALLTLAAIIATLFVLSGCNRGVGPPTPDPNAIRHDKKG